MFVQLCNSKYMQNIRFNCSVYRKQSTISVTLYIAAYELKLYNF